MRIEETVIEVLKSSEIKSKSLRLPAGKWTVSSMRKSPS